AARRPSGPDLDVELLDPMVDAVVTSAAARREAGRRGIEIVAVGDVSSWKSNEHVSSLGALPGEWKSIGSDPQLVSPALDVRASAFRHLVIRMRASTRSMATRVQIYWALRGQGEFTEMRSATVLVDADGLDATYVIDWYDRSRDRPFRDTDRLLYLRVDPLDSPGSFRVGAVLLLPGDPDLSGFGDVRPDQGETFVLSGTAESARRDLAQRLRGEALDVAALRRQSGGTTAEIVRSRAEPGIRVDIVVPVYNARALVERCLRSVLEHARGDYRLLVIDDASTDPDLAPLLTRI